jgi:hypothetical protein
MKKGIVILLALVLSLMVVPMIGHADHPDESTVNVADTAYVLVDESGPTVSLWQESNGHAGLQTQNDDNGTPDDTTDDVPADTLIA